MKLNVKSSKITLKGIGIFSFIAAAAFLALRFYQLTRLTDPATGFFTDHTNFTVIIFYALSILFPLGVVILCYLSGDINGDKAPSRRSAVHGVFSLLFGASLLLEGVADIKEMAGIVARSGGFKPAVEEMDGYITPVLYVMELLTGIVLTLHAIGFISGKMFITKLKICALFPVLWAFFLTVSYFTITASYLKVTQLMLTIFADAFLMVFLFEYARFISGINFKGSAWVFYAAGIAAAALLLISSVPDLVFYIFEPRRLVVYCPFALYNLLGGLFVISAMAYTSRCEQPIQVEGFTGGADEEPEESL